VRLQCYAGVVSFLPHLVIPGLTALVFLRVERWRILAWSPLVWAADADYVLQSEHRALTHSLLIPLAVAAALVALWRLRDPSAQFWEFARRPGAPANLMLAAYFLASHLVMDVFQGGVVLLWPLLDVNFYLAFEILLDTGNNQFTPTGEAGTSEGAPELSPVYPCLSTRDTAYLAFFASVAAAWGLHHAWRRWRRGPQPRPVHVQRHAVAMPASGLAVATTPRAGASAGRTRTSPGGTRKRSQ
jgi:hypothetical protein